MVMKPSSLYNFIFGIFTHSEEKVLVIKFTCLYEFHILFLFNYRDYVITWKNKENERRTIRTCSLEYNK